MQEELANKADNCAVSYYHLTGRILVQLNNGACLIIPYLTVEVKHIWQVYVTSELKKKLFCFFTRHDMNFYSYEKQIFKSFSCTKIRKDSKCTKTNQNEVMQPTTSNIDSRPIFPYHVHHQADPENPFIIIRGFICLGISKMSFTFYVFTRVQCSISIKGAKG